VTFGQRSRSRERRTVSRPELAGHLSPTRQQGHCLAGASGSNISMRLGHRSADADDATADAVAGVAGRLRLEVVRVGVDDQPAANDRVLASEADDAVLHVDRGNAILVGDEVAEIAGMALLIVRSAVRHAGRIEMPAGALRIRAIAELVNVEAVLAGL